MDYNVTDSVFNVAISAGQTFESFNIDIIGNEVHQGIKTFSIATTLLQSCLSFYLDISSSTISIIEEGMLCV